MDLGGRAAPGCRVVPGGVGSQVRCSLIPPGLSAARIPRWDLWRSGPGRCRPGNIAIATASAAWHRPRRLGSQGHHSPQHRGYTGCTATRGAPPRPALTQEESECQEVHGQPSALPRGTRRQHCGRVRGMAWGARRPVPGLSRLWHGHAPRGAPTQHGGAPWGQHWEVGLDGAVGSRSSPGWHPVPTPVAMPQTGAYGCAPHPQTAYELCRAPSCPARGGSIPSGVTGVPGGSQHQARASRGGEPGAPEPARQGRPCCWLGSRC